MTSLDRLKLVRSLMDSLREDMVGASATIPATWGRDQILIWIAEQISTEIQKRLGS